MKSAFILALALFWALAINHCRLEIVSELAFLTCATESPADASHHHQPRDCESDGCEAIEDGFYKASEPYVSAPRPILTQVLFPANLTLLDPPLVVPSPSPQTADAAWRLASAWQFSCRAAPSPRAPSRTSQVLA